VIPFVTEQSTRQRATATKVEWAAGTRRPATDAFSAPSDKPAARLGSASSGMLRRAQNHFPATVAQRLFRICANLVGAASAAVFAYSFLHYYFQSHRLIGIAFFAQQTLVALAYLIRRPARFVSRYVDDWLLAFAGTFAGVLFRPEGAHTAWGIQTGLVLQLLGVAVVVASLLTLVSPRVAGQRGSPAAVG
jgi:hypothetical protein